MTRMIFGISAAALMITGLAVPAAPALAQQARSGAIIVYGNDPCPRAADDDIVVCSRRPEAERYRIPEKHRPSGSRQARQAWSTQAQALNSVGSTGINSCSAVGPAGHTGCLQQMIDQARAETTESTAEGAPPE